MNCESWEVPKNSRIEATTGRMLMSVVGVIASTSWVVMRSRTTRSMRDSPVRTWFWMSSPTARMRRLPKWSMSSVSTRRSTGWPLRVPGIVSAPLWRAQRYFTEATMSSTRSTDTDNSASRPSFLLILYRPTLARSYRFGLK